MEKTVCELFAGVGGFRLGLERANPDWNTVWANQWEPGKKAQHAFDCYCCHFGKSVNHVNKDISEVDKTSIPDHNLLVGGFPCQDYSVARTGATGINGKKGVLWWDIRDILEAKSPSFVILENVDRLLKSPAKQRGRDFGIILTCFHQLGYNVEWRIINAAEYGFAQRRRRVFIFAYKNTTAYSAYIAKLAKSPECIFNNGGFFAHTFKIEAISSDNICTTELVESDLADVTEHFAYSFGNSGFMYNGTIHTCNTTPIYEDPTLLKSIIEKNVDSKYYLAQNLEKWEFLKGAKKIERTSKSGHKYIFSEGPISFPDSIDKPARTMLTSESSLNRSTHVIRDPETGHLRLLTPVEAERIQGFDDNWTKTGMPERFRYFCMGNALVVGLITRMGTYLNKIFEHEVLLNIAEDREAI
ncbi:DNA (cytosine-5-)-methyltransferase [Bariatricus massiliensis]|uniref:Cytosine-specific methyltransferase n=1 Tax=Bariatricus massiliensis TaxID=1745713 RepID=A0ABS8DL60_9FIRM|nr:DNA (cytosine-5-)-methyltransferase [Bariatricus massiliensis]MCB7306052.1 DNA (cytosine-5-)-methyltransferase [Bariatricus massiliensis]MCB7376579.1 DNA (cytosine-5-)-methyltransferase [Bariatricus massiliensis]MCB7389195.1 DNA (cytosine-5-)-methyltransferase [Bariatricus massiliensis]MCB7413368.1 DNA (cytosine-5-)-methyltransferase [Bariatricus massiliensis]MCQ5255304.1 DNA (cytosine-5-)-methyltransferase [Bariatricus massiliensis]